MSESAGEKTFEATSHRRQEARDKGQVAFSQDLGSAALLLLGVFLLMMLGGGVVQFSAGLMQHSWATCPNSWRRRRTSYTIGCASRFIWASC
jgi:flagellar biosynthesis protein FlhB